MGQTSGQKQSKKFTRQAVGTLEATRGQFQQDPLYLFSRMLAERRLQDPYTYDPTTLAMMEASSLDQAQGAYDSSLRNMWERAGASGGYRSGFTRGQEMRAAQGLGETRGNIIRGIRTQAALQRPQDERSAIATGMEVMSPLYQFGRDLANLYQGASTSPLWAQPSTGAQIGQGVGQIGGNVLGALAMPVPQGGTSGLFK